MIKLEQRSRLLAVRKLLGAIGPKDAALVLDTPEICECLTARIEARWKDKASVTLVLNPKDGLMAIEVAQKLPLTKIYVLVPNIEVETEEPHPKKPGVMRKVKRYVCDTTFDQQLASLGLTSKQVLRWHEGGTITDSDGNPPEDVKFDLIIGNPPYLRDLHVKIIAESIKRLSDDGVCVMVHPSMPYLRPKAGGLQQHLSHLSLHAATDFWPDNNVTIWVPLAIATLKKQQQTSFIVGGEQVAVGTKLSRYGRDRLVMSIKDKFTNGDVLSNHVLRGEANKPFIVQLPYITGGYFDADRHYIIALKKPISQQVSNEAGKAFNVSFDTKQEALHFASFLTSKIAMAGFVINKVNQHISFTELSAIPWLDFTKHWTDEMLYEHFKLTPEEIAWVEALPAHPRRSDPV